MKIKLSKSNQNNIIFKDFEMDIKDYHVNIVMGPSGCGKTTLLNCIARLSKYKGYIDNHHQSIGYVFQEDRLFPYLTVMNNLKIIEKNNQKIKTFMKQFQVYDLKDQYPHHLSGGEKQRISIIRAFIRQNDLVLMDEAFKSLDYHLKWQLVELIAKIQKEMKQTLILVTHDIEIALYLGHYIHVLTKKTTQLKESISNPYIHQELNENSVILRNKLKYLLTH